MTLTTIYELKHIQRWDKKGGIFFPDNELGLKRPHFAFKLKEAKHKTIKKKRNFGILGLTETIDTIIF